MSRPLILRLRAGFLTLLSVIVLGLLAPSFLTAAAAAEPAAKSLSMVPQDVAFYSAMLRNREQLEFVANSNFWKRLNQWELVRQLRIMAEGGLQAQGGDWQQVLQWAEQPENQQLVDVLTEMFSDEVFCYGDQQTVGTLSLLLDAVNSMRYGPAMHKVVDTDLSEEEFTAKVLLDLMADDLDNVAVPGLVMGFKIKNPDAAEEQLRRLEGYARVMLENVPELEPLKDGLRTVKIGENDFLTLTVSGELVPWDEVPFEDLEDTDGDYDDLRKKLKESTVVISMGLRDGYMLLSIGKSTEHLTKLGKGDVLADHSTLAPLNDVGTQRFTSISYASETLMSALGTKPEDLDNLVDLADGLLPLAEQLNEEARAQMREDAEELAADLKPYIPKNGAQLSFSYLTDRGVESQHYNWTENKLLDGTQPLSLFNHLGGSPIFAVLARAQHRPEDYDLVVKWLRKGRGYFEQLAVPEMSPEEQDVYERIKEAVFPLLEKIDTINRKMLIPALADGQTGLVLDGNIKTTQWTQHLPPTAEEIALPAPALLFGVADADLLGQALGEYRSVVNSAIAEAHKADPKNVPDVELPPARSRKLDSGATIYYYRLPEQLGIYSQVVPNVSVADKVAIMSLLPKQTVNLAAAKPLDVQSGPLADVDRPLAAATYFNSAAMVDMIVPWVNEGVRAYARAMQQAFDQLDVQPDGQLNADGDSEMVVGILDNIKQGAAFLKVYRGYSSVTFVKDGALVTHSEAHYRDLK